MDHPITITVFCESNRGFYSDIICTCAHDREEGRRGREQERWREQGEMGSGSWG